MFDVFLRELKDRLIQPVTKLFVSLSPTQLTWVSFVFGILCSASLLYEYDYRLCVLLWWLNRIFGTPKFAELSSDV